MGTAVVYDEWFDADRKYEPEDLAATDAGVVMAVRANEALELYPVLMRRAMVGEDMPGWWQRAAQYAWSVATWNLRVAGMPLGVGRDELNAKANAPLGKSRKLSNAAHELGDGAEWAALRREEVGEAIVELVTRTRLIAAGAKGADDVPIGLTKADRSLGNKAVNALVREHTAYVSLLEMSAASG